MVKLSQNLVERELLYLEIEDTSSPVCFEQRDRDKVSLLHPKMNHNQTGEIIELIVPSEEIIIKEDLIYFLENGISNIQFKRYFPSDPEYKEKYLALEGVGLI